MDIGERKLNLAEVTAIGIGGMIGGGIFAVLGLAIAKAGHAVPLTLARRRRDRAAHRAVLRASRPRLPRRWRQLHLYRARLRPARPWPAVAGWLLVAGYVGTLALYATAFGAYGATLIAGIGTPGLDQRRRFPRWCWSVSSPSISVGAKTSGMTELIVVAIKLTILAGFAIAGLHSAQAEPFPAAVRPRLADAVGRGRLDLRRL